MKTDFYTNVSLVGDGILYRGFSNGKEVSRVDHYHPTLFVKSESETDYKTLDGDYVEAVVPGTIRECREFVNTYSGINNFTVYGNTDYVYQYIGDYFSKDVEYEFDKIPICYMDIETTCDGGFPSVENPTESVIAITVSMLGETHVFGLGKFHSSDIDTFTYDFEREEDLLLSFIEWWENNPPHVITGWNVKLLIPE